jgi:hypothetical protein
VYSDCVDATACSTSLHLRSQELKAAYNAFTKYENLLSESGAARLYILLDNKEWVLERHGVGQFLPELMMSATFDQSSIHVFEAGKKPSMKSKGSIAKIK